MLVQISPYNKHRINNDNFIKENATKLISQVKDCFKKGLNQGYDIVMKYTASNNSISHMIY